MFENVYHACLPTCIVQIPPNLVEFSSSQKVKIVATYVSFLEHKKLWYLDKYFMRYGPNIETRWAGLGMHISHVVPQM